MKDKTLDKISADLQERRMREYLAREVKRSSRPCAAPGCSFRVTTRSSTGLCYLHYREAKGY